MSAVTPTRRPSPWWWLGLSLLTFVAIQLAFQTSAGDRPITVPYSTFREQAQAGNIARVDAQGETIEGAFRKPLRYPEGDDGRTSSTFETERPTFADDALLPLLLSKGTVVGAEPESSGSTGVAAFLIGLLPILLFFGVILWFVRRAAGGAASGGSMFSGLGRSKARRYEAKEMRTSFADVAGIDEATDELVEIVGFLRDPGRYRKLGATIPKGVLLTGLPGTGKTLLARAVAGEAQVPFFSISASEFVEMIVGVGASRVRDLFEQATQAAPSIIFVDELDAIGRARGAGALSGANDEREQTLNQLLPEMDGFSGSEGVIVLAATNRPEILDPALLRSGRFDRRIAVHPPDRQGREQILKVHTRSVPLAEEVDLDLVASITPGMVGADLRTLVNEAALRAARHEQTTVAQDDFTAALERIVLGTARRIVLSTEERRRTAFHEAGHALLGMLLPGADPVRKVSIIPRGNALGVTYQSPDADRYGATEAYLLSRIVGMLGGRAAEHLVHGETTTGAESDLEQATAIARQMVGRWGMSDAIGPVSVLPRPGEERFVMPGDAGGSSARTLELIDEEVRRIIDECFARALQTLTDHRSQLDALAAALLERETLDEDQAHEAAGLPRVAHVRG